MAGRKFVGFNVDTFGPTAVAAFAKELSVTANTPAHIGPMLKYAHAELSVDFDMHMSLQAPQFPSRFHHVYEWNRIGEPQARLWKNVLKGHGNSRTATFEWRASKSIVPVRQDLPETNSYGKPMKTEGKPKAIHVFVWKAPIMEYGESTHVAPERGEFIVYYTGEWKSNSQYYQKLWFSRKAITIKDPGGKHVQGSFTREYVNWWSKGEASRKFRQHIKGAMEKNTEQMAHEGLATIGSRSRQRSFNIRAMSNQRAAMSTGRAAARLAMSRMERRYIDAAKQREAFMS